MPNRSAGHCAAVHDVVDRRERRTRRSRDRQPAERLGAILEPVERWAARPDRLADQATDHPGLLVRRAKIVVTPGTISVTSKSPLGRSTSDDHGCAVLGVCSEWLAFPG